jgi:hypothetical protein
LRHTYLYGWIGYALFIVYEFLEPDKNRKKQKVDEHGNSNSRISDGGNPNFPYFVCQFQANEVDLEKPIVLFYHRVPSVEPSGFWVYIKASWFLERTWIPHFENGRLRSLEASITTGSQNVEVKECRARVVHDDLEFYQVLNNISPGGLDLKNGWKSLSDVFTWNSLCVKGLKFVSKKDKKKLMLSESSFPSQRIGRSDN